MAKESSDIRDVLEELGRRPARLHRVRLPGRREHPRGRRPGPPRGTAVNAKIDSKGSVPLTFH